MTLHDYESNDLASAERHVRDHLPAPIADDDFEQLPEHCKISLDTLSGLLRQLVDEIDRQDRKHGAYSNQGASLMSSRLALATLEDEVSETLEAWRAERQAENWSQTRAELLQVAAVAIRTLRDALPEPRYER